MAKRVQILIVDDEPDIRTVVRLPLESKGYDVAEAASGPEAIEYIRRHKDLDLVLMDIMMPGMSGVAATEELRRLTSAPVLFITALTQERDMLAAYGSGGDDFLGKPFSQAELIMKVETLLRRYRVYKGKPEVETLFGTIELDHDKHELRRDGAEILLTDTEYDILSVLLAHRGCAVSVKELYEDAWKEKYLPSSSNTIMVHILNLRKKIEEDPANPRFIRTIWGKGYQID